MPVTIPYTFTQDTPSSAPNVNADFTALKNFVDALQAGTNFDAGAISTAAIADAAITSVKLDSSALASADSDQFVLAGQVFG